MPQCTPMPPLLSNLRLTDLDRELERRGDRFCRSADNCNIYVNNYCWISLSIMGHYNETISMNHTPNATLRDFSYQSGKAGILSLIYCQPLANFDSILHSLMKFTNSIGSFSIR